MTVFFETWVTTGGSPKGNSDFFKTCHTDRTYKPGKIGQEVCIADPPHNF